jgi:hypothetical protein
MFLVPRSKIENLLETQEAATVSLWHKDAPHPPQTVLVSKDIIRKIATDHAPADLILTEAINNDDLAVETEFTATALNSINSLYYSSCSHAFDKKSSLATFFVKNRMAQYVLLQTILARVSSKAISIKEICCGAVYSRWQHFEKFLPNDRKIQAILADLSADIIPQERIDRLNLRNIDFAYEAYDLREGFTKRDQKLDVILVTYGFDSVWLEDDAMYVKRNGEWYQIKYRVKVLPNAEAAKKLVELLRQGYSDEPLALEAFDSVVIETIAEKVDIHAVQYGEYIHKLYGSYAEARTSVPGAIITRVEEAFATQLKDDGIFVIGEVATYPVKSDEEVELTIVDYNTTGKVGKYKVEDFYLAEAILKDKGYVVEVLDMQKEAEKLGKKIEEDCEDTWLMVVRKK